MSRLDHSVVAHLPLFAGVEPPVLDEMLREAQSLRIAQGATVFAQGEEAHSFFILLHGHLRVSRLTPQGQQVLVRHVAPGEVCGIALAIGLTHYPATAIAVVDSMALVWPSAAWPRLIASHPALSANTLQKVAASLQEEQTGAVEMSIEPPGPKVETDLRIDAPISR